MQALIYNPFANKNAGFKNVLSIAVAFFSGGISAHSETRFKANQTVVDFFQKRKVYLGSQHITFNLDVEYVINMTTKGLVIQTWEERNQDLNKHYKGSANVYEIDDVDFEQLCWDIKALCERNAKYGFIEAFRSSTDKTLLGKVLDIYLNLKKYFAKKILRKKIKPADFCSQTSIVTNAKVSAKFREKICYTNGLLRLNLANPKHFKALKQFAVNQTPVEYKALLEATYTRQPNLYWE